MIKIKKVKKNRTANKSGFRKAATYVSKTIYFYAVVKDNVNLFGLLSICKPDRSDQWGVAHNDVGNPQNGAVTSQCRGEKDWMTDWMTEKTSKLIDSL